MNDDLAERLDAVEEKIGRRTPTHTKQETEAIRAALRWRYSHETTVDYNGHNDAVMLAEAAEHIEEPHAATLRDMLSGSDV